MISLSGRGLHTGVPSTVRFVLRPEDGSGLRFFFPGFPRPLDGRALRTPRRSARRATVLEDGAGAVVRTPEHLLAAALFFAAAPIDVVCDQPEPPGLDGSARPWFTAFAMAAPEAAALPEYAASGWRHDGPEGSLDAEPSDRFSVEYLLERGSRRESFRLESAAAAPAEVLPARTFIFRKDWLALQAGATDLLAGAGPGSGLLLAESPEEFAEVRALPPERRDATADGANAGEGAFPLLHPERFRFPAEPARHKILDLLGDLALNGLALPRLRIRIRNGGHALNHLLLDHLQTSSPERPR